MSDFPGSGETDPGGANSSDPAPAPPSVPSTGVETIMYCTLPLQIAEVQQGAGALTRLDWKQFQTAPRFQFRLIDGSGLPMKLAGAAVTLRLATLIGATLLIEDVMTLDYADGGIVGYHLARADVAVAGTFSLEIEVVQSNGDTLYFPSDGNVLFVISKALGGS